MIKIYPRESLADAALVEGYKKVSPSTIGHLTDRGFMKGLQSLLHPVKMVGTAVTVRIPHMDSTAVHIAIDLLQERDVLVVDMSGDTERACFGGVFAYATKAAGGHRRLYHRYRGGSPSEYARILSSGQRDYHSSSGY